jgi:hypothetical protein
MGWPLWLAVLAAMGVLLNRSHTPLDLDHDDEVTAG